jgi:hypothetical protein
VAGQAAMSSGHTAAGIRRRWLDPCGYARIGDYGGSLTLQGIGSNPYAMELQVATVGSDTNATCTGRAGPTIAAHACS